jgi:hypothetical protein
MPFSAPVRRKMNAVPGCAELHGKAALSRETYLLTKTMPNSWQAPLLRLLSSVALLAGVPAMGQNPVASPYIASTPAQTLQAAGVQISGDVHVANGSMQLGNGSTITAGNETLPIALVRGGELKLCATTSVHLARDRSIQAPDASGLMLGLDRGALEAHYPTSKYSDVLLTPDLRILISGPGETNLSVRVNRQGDTCIDNRGPNAPYITVSSQFEDGLYRVQPNQHVSFQHGSLREVVDSETEPCGCPPSVPLAVASSTPNNGGHPVGGPSSTPADTTFPLAVSEGLTSPPLPPTTPVAAPGEVHAQVAVPFRYNGSLPTVDAAGNTAEPAISSAVAVPPPSPAAPAPTPSNMSAPPPPPVPSGSLPATAAVPLQATITPVAAPQSQLRPSRGFFHRIGRFFSRLFGAES